MVKVYGYSDDIVEVEDNNGKCIEEIDCFDSDVRIWFTDKTQVLIHYGKKNLAVWDIKVENKGSGFIDKHICNDESADIYSDIVFVNADIASYKVLGR